MRVRHRLAATTVAVTAIGLSMTGQVPAQAAAHPDRLAVADAQPSLAAATSTGAAAAGQRVQVTVYLALRHTAELDARVRAVSDPASAQYAHYLTGAQFRARYAPTQATVEAVSSYLKGFGLVVTDVPDNHTSVSVSGTVAQASAAFATQLRTYRVKGTTLRAAASPATLPAALASEVIAVSGLASTSSLMAPDHVVDGNAPPPAAFVNGTPCSAYYGEKVATTLPSFAGKKQPYVPCGYTPSQLQSAYGLSSSLAHGFDGSGVTVAIVDAYAAPTIASDADTYAVDHGGAPFAAHQFRQVRPSSYTLGYDDTVNGDQCGEQGWYGEETLDVEAVHAMAPGAKITYVAASSCDNGDLADAMNKIVDRHLADIVTDSWGGTDESNGSPQLDQEYQQIFYQAALEGIGFYFSAGDDGDGSTDNGGVPTPEAPANSNLVTAVGGTALAIGSSGQRKWETGWNTAKYTVSGTSWAPLTPGVALYGGGGGTSQVFTQPWYQQGIVPARLSQLYSATPGRVIPDVSDVGDVSTGFLVGETQTFPDGSTRYSEYRIGGTSLSSPVFAGIMAIADQVAGHPHGFANPALYSAYAAFGTKAFYDDRALSPRGVVRVEYANGVDPSMGTVTSLRTIGSTVGTILRTTRGYDDQTGLGSPNGAALIGALS